MAQNPKKKKKKRKLPKNIAERPDREIMEKLFGKRIMKELDKLRKEEPENVENKGDWKHDTSVSHLS